MSSPSDTMIITLKGDLNEIADLVNSIQVAAERFNLSAEIASQLSLVLEELYCNSVNYGLLHTVKPEVIIKLTLSKAVLRIIYRDNGMAFNPLDIKMPDVSLGIDERPLGGLGIFFVKSFTDSAEYSYDSGFNQINLIKQL